MCHSCEDSKNPISTPFSMLDEAAAEVRAALEATGGLDWLDDAACAGSGLGRWFPAQSSNLEVVETKAVCETCPVLTTCATYIAGQKVFRRNGIVAGTTGSQRKNARLGYNSHSYRKDGTRR